VRIVNLLEPGLVNICELAFVEQVAVAFAVFLLVNFRLVAHGYESLVLLLKVEHVLVVV
jgi:hypothetical protein